MAKIPTTGTSQFITSDSDKGQILKTDYAANWQKADDNNDERIADIAEANEAIAEEVVDRTNADTQTLNSAVAAAQTYVDAVIRGLSIKAPVRAVAVGNVSIATPGSVFDTVTFSNAGIDSVLLAGQTDPTQNGLYTWYGASTLLLRRSDADSSVEMVPGLLVTVLQGLPGNADTIWELKTDGPIILGTTALNFALASASGSSSSAAVLVWNGTSYPPRNAATTSTTTPVPWVGPVAPTVGGGYALAGDIWINTTEVN